MLQWDGCNECQVLLNTPTGIYASFVMTVVAEEDASRAIWPSCPARGWASGVEKLTARPVPGAQLVPHTLKERTLETHGPYQHGNGFPATNGGNDMKGQECRSRIPIQISQSETGLSQPNIFASEFGCIGMSSFESMSPLLKPEHWGLHAGLPGDNCSTSWDRECHGANPMSLRNYPCDNLISCKREDITESCATFSVGLSDILAHRLLRYGQAPGRRGRRGGLQEAALAVHDQPGVGAQGRHRDPAGWEYFRDHRLAVQ